MTPQPDGSITHHHMGRFGKLYARQALADWPSGTLTSWLELIVRPIIAAGVALLGVVSCALLYAALTALATRVAAVVLESAGHALSFGAAVAAFVITGLLAALTLVAGRREPRDAATTAVDGDDALFQLMARVAPIAHGRHYAYHGVERRGGDVQHTLDVPLRDHHTLNLTLAVSEERLRLSARLTTWDDADPVTLERTWLPSREGRWSEADALVVPRAHSADVLPLAIADCLALFLDGHQRPHTPPVPEATLEASETPREVIDFGRYAPNHTHLTLRPALRPRVLLEVIASWAWTLTDAASHALVPITVVACGALGAAASASAPPIIIGVAGALAAVFWQRRGALARRVRLFARRVRVGPRTPLYLTRGGGLVTCHDGIDLMRPFTLHATLSTDGGSVVVSLHQRRGGRRPPSRLAFAVPTHPHPSLSSLPRLDRSAPSVAPEALDRWLWPALTAAARSHGVEIPSLGLAARP